MRATRAKLPAVDDLSLAQAAKRFKVPKRTLLYAAKQGHLKARMIGRQYVVSPQDVGVWIASGAHVPTRAPKRTTRLTK